MKNLYLSVILLCSVAFAGAQSKLDFYGQHALMAYKNGLLTSEVKDSGNRISPYSQLGSDERVAVLVTLNEESSIDGIELNGAEILSRRADMAIVSIPMSQLEGLSKFDAVKHISFPKTAKPLVNEARKATFVDWVHSGDGLDKGYIGEGVVVGLMDTGLDPNHVAFRDTANVKNRVQRVWHMTGSDGSYTEYSTPEAIASFNTDNKSMGHGTHVAGIMAGGYKGNAFYGVAPGADIAMAGGNLYDANILIGVEKIIDYASAQGKPVVVNLSLGNNVGPHDGTEAYTRYMDELAKEAIVCVAAGNEGQYPIVLSKTFTATDKQMKSFIVENYQPGLLEGVVDIWSSDNVSFSAYPVIYDVVADTVVYEMPAIENCVNGAYLCSKDYVLPDGAQMFKDDGFTAAFDGYIGYASGLSSSNNRYETILTYSISSTTSNKGQFALAVYIKGKEGQRVDAYCDGSTTQFDTKSKTGWDVATTDGTINSWACGHNVIVVGSFNSRQNYTRLDGKTYGYPSLPVGPISPFSSYGTLIDGRSLPHLCAPGSILISSIGKTFAAQQILQGVYSKYTDYAAKAVEGTRTDYWDVMMGTSMSSPFVAGAVALMLEANPDLTKDEVLEILMSTADKDSYVTDADPVKAGAGKINVYSAMVKAIESKAGVDGGLTDCEKKFMLNSLGNNIYDVYVAGEDKLNINLYNMSGIPVISVVSEDNNVTIDAGNLEKGVYVLTVQGRNSKHTRRILVK